MVMPADDGYQEIAELLGWHEAVQVSRSGGQRPALLLLHEVVPRTALGAGHSFQRNVGRLVGRRVRGFGWLF